MPPVGGNHRVTTILVGVAGHRVGYFTCRASQVLASPISSTDRFRWTPRFFRLEMNTVTRSVVEMASARSRT